ncbi:hypothetical protein CSOJ01_15547 [Colletotrichum sojae]|uniref:Uncharacterized protein n=1 Tax=Colletotrichum sojae TaxID=2175907 RepID=A0A8H6MIS6_9PEZI|nr:hypothetical protein CSOJ01_15547 [Colletotrichum sojae]
MHAAAKRGHLAVVKLLLSAKVNVNAKGGRYGSVLSAAVSEGHISIVRELLGAGFLVRSRGGFDDRRNEALYLAVERGSLELVELLLAHGARDYESIKTYPASALHCATLVGRLDIVKELLRHESIVSENWPDGLSQSQHSAVELKHKEILRELAKYEVRPRKKIYDGFRVGDYSLLLEGLNDGEDFSDLDLELASLAAPSAGSLAIWRELIDRGASPHVGALTSAAGGKDLDLVQLLANAGADVNPPGNGPVRKAVEAKRWEVVEFLVGRGADLHLALQDVVLSGDAEAFEKLFQYGADIDRQECEILQAAARGGSVAIIEFILKTGIDINLPGETSSITPLMEAIRSTKWKAMRFLLDHGADVNVPAPPGRGPIRDDRNVIDGLRWRQYDGIETPVTLAARAGAGNICVELIQRGATVRGDSPVTSGTPLLYAVWEQLPRLVDEFLRHGADPNQQGTVLSAPFPKQSTPLLLAVEKKNVATVQRLMAAGAYVNVQDKEGFSPVHLAATITNFPPKSSPDSDGKVTEILKLLVHRYHADVNGPQLLNGSLPIHLAASRGDVEHVQILVDAGADVNALNNDGRTPIHWAAERGRWDVVEVLLDKGADPQIRSTEDSLQTAWDLAQAAREVPLWELADIEGWDDGRIKALLERLDLDGKTEE